MKNYGYIRVSTADQNTSLEVQQERITEYCKFKKLENPIYYIDEDVSGKLPILQRPEGSKLKDIHDSNVIAVKLDRLFRNTIDSLTMREIWEKQNVSIHLIDYGGNSIDTSSAVGVMLFTQLASYAEFERRIIGERTKAALQHKKNNGKVYSIAPYGFETNNKDLRKNGKEQKTIDLILSMRKEGFALSKIAKTLNNREIPTRKGKEWHASTISYILKNKLYEKG